MLVMVKVGMGKADMALKYIIPILLILSGTVQASEGYKHIIAITKLKRPEHTMTNNYWNRKKKDAKVIYDQKGNKIEYNGPDKEEVARLCLWEEPISKEPVEEPIQ